MSERWPLRATFAHWVLGLISPWLALTPFEEDEEDEDRSEAAWDAGFEAGHARGYEDGHRDETRGYWS